MSIWNWFGASQKPKSRRARAKTSRLGLEQLEHRSLLATISGTVFDDVNANSIRDTSRITFQGAVEGRAPVVVYFIDVSRLPVNFSVMPGADVGDVNGDRLFPTEFSDDIRGGTNTYLDVQIQGLIDLNRSLINQGYGQTGRVMIIGYAGSAAAVDFDRDLFTNTSDNGVTVISRTRYFAAPAEDLDQNGVPDVEQMARRFREGHVPQNGVFRNPRTEDRNQNTDPQPDIDDPATDNQGDENFIRVNYDQPNFTIAHNLALGRLYNDPIVTEANGQVSPALQTYANRITMIVQTASTFVNTDYSSIVAPPALPAGNSVQFNRSLGVQYYAFGLGNRTNLAQLRLISASAQQIGNYGEYQLFVSGSRPTEAGVARAKVYIDANNNGILDSGERSVDSSVDLATTLIDEGGLYSFTNLGPGTYIIRQSLPLTSSQTSPTSAAFRRVTITSTSQTVAGIDFGRTPNNTIRGFVYNDVDDDGVFTLGTDVGLAGAQVYLDINRNGIRDRSEPTAVTARDNAATVVNEAGTYTFNNVERGTYIVRVVAPTGYTVTGPGIPVAGSPATPGKEVRTATSWTVTLPFVSSTNQPVRSVSEVNFSLFQGTRPARITTSGGATVYSEGQAATKRTFVDPSVSVTVGAATNLTGAVLSVAILTNADFVDELFLRPGKASGLDITLETQPGDPVPEYTIRSGTRIVASAVGGLSSPLVITFNTGATAAMVQSLARLVEFRNLDANISNLVRTVGFQVQLPGAAASNLGVRTIRVFTKNAAPVLTNPGPTQVPFNVGDPPVQPFTGITIADADNPPNLNRGYVRVTPIGSVSSGDTISIEENTDITLNDPANPTEVSFQGVVIGTMASGAGRAGGSFQVNLNANATTAAVEALITSIRFSTDATPRAIGDTTLRLVVNDGGTNGTSAPIDVLVAITGAPQLAALAFAIEPNQRRR